MSKRRTGEEIATLNEALVIQDGKEFKEVGIVGTTFAAIFILGMFFPIALADITAQLYQFVYFGIHNIPKIERKKYIVIDRAHLSKLNWIQRFSCVYCGYANGVISWMHDLGAQTEIYSCAIKHWHPAKGQENTQKNYFAHRTFT